jgi:hypothetical protein
MRNALTEDWLRLVGQVWIGEGSILLAGEWNPSLRERPLHLTGGELVRAGTATASDGPEHEDHGEHCTRGGHCQPIGQTALAERTLAWASVRQ